MISKKSFINIKNFLILFSFFLFFLQAFYFLVFSHVTFDEASYLYKGLNFWKGVYKPFANYGLWTEYTPFAYYLLSFSQLISGPNFYTAKIVPIFFYFLTLVFSYKLAKTLFGEFSAVLTLIILSSNYQIVQALSAIVPYSLLTFFLVFSIYILTTKIKPPFKEVFCLFLIIFSAFIREKIFPLAFFIFLFLFFKLRKNIFSLILLLLTVVLANLAFILPFYPGIMVKLRNTFSLLFSWRNFLRTEILGSSSALGIDILDIIKGFYYFYNIYYLPILVSVFLMLFIFSHSLLTKKRIVFNSYVFLFIALIIINFIAHSFVYPSFCPKCLIGFPYIIFPLWAILIGAGFGYIYNLFREKKMRILLVNLLLTLFIFYLIPSPYHLVFPPKFPTPIQLNQKAAKRLAQLIKPEEKIFALGGLPVLYLAERQTYPQMINHYYGFKETNNTAELLKGGYWNWQAAERWLASDADWAIIDKGLYDFFDTHSSATKKTTDIMEKELQENYVLKEKILENRNKYLEIYERKHQ